MKQVILIGLAAFACLSVFSQGAKPDSSIFGEIEARGIGPAIVSGRVTDVDVPSDDDKTIYMGTAGGGVWKSTTSGMTWKPIFEKYAKSIGCVTVDPNEPETIWVGTGEINTRNSVSFGDGLYKSTDGGESWKHMGFKDSERIAEVRVHPENSDVVFVAVLGHLWGDHEERGLYKTTDGGETWEQIIAGDKSTGCIDVDIDPQNPDIMYAAMWQVRRWPWFFESGGPASGLHKSVDGGETWTRLEKGLPEGDLGRIDLDIAPTRPNRLYAIVEGGEKQTGLYRSDDHGESWEKVNDSFNTTARPFYLTIVKADPVDYKRVYNPSLSLTISKDSGKTFSGAGGVGVHGDWQSIWINPKDPSHVIAGTDGGLYISHDSARNFRMVLNLPISTFYRIGVDNQVPYRIFGGMQDNGTWMGPSAGPTGQVRNKDWTLMGGGDGFCSFSDASNPNYVYWEYQGGNLNRMDLEAGENKIIIPYPEEGMAANRFNWNAPLSQGVANPKNIYFGSQYVYKSVDQGDTWLRISPDLTTNDPEKLKQEESGGLTRDATTAENHCTVFTIAESPLDENIVWAGTDDGNLQVTRDGGKTWTNTTPNIPDLPANTWCSSVWPSYHAKGVAYATFDGHRSGDKTPYVYVSEDFGQSWRNIASEDLEWHNHVIRQDPVNPDLLFLGSESGLYVSIDNGANWIRFESGIPPYVSVRDMAFQLREGDLVIATHGLGVYILDDLTPLRGLTAEVMSQKVALLPSRPFQPYSTALGTWPQGGNIFGAPNPDTGVNITYFLKRRHLLGDLTVEVFDAEGNKIKSIPGGKRKGVNRANWSMRLKAPRVASSRGFGGRSLIGPRAPEGTYTIKLTKGKDVIETTVEVTPPVLNKHSKEDRELQYKTVMALYDLQEELAFLGDRVKSLMDQIDERAEKAEGKLKTQLEARSKSLKDFMDTIISPAPNRFVDQDRLREHVVKLYFSVSQFRGRPTQNQLDETPVMESRVAEASKTAEPLLDVADLNKGLKRKKLDLLEPLTREAWIEAESKSASGTLSSEQFGLALHMLR